MRDLACSVTYTLGIWNTDDGRQVDSLYCESGIKCTVCEAVRQYSLRVEGCGKLCSEHYGILMDNLGWFDLVALVKESISE